MAVSFEEVAKILSQLDSVSSRNEMVVIISQFYRRLDSEEIQIFSYLLEGRVAPQFVPAEFNFSEKSLVNVLSDLARGFNFKFDFAQERLQSGDVGDTAYLLRETMNAANVTQRNLVKLSLKEVYLKLWEIVLASGTGSVKVKSSIFLDLFTKLTPTECKYLSRIVSGKLRLGCNVKTLLDALSIMIVGDKSLRDRLDLAYGFATDVGYLASVLLGEIEKQDGIGTEKEIAKIDSRLEKIIPTPGVPMFPRLVERVGSFEEAFERLEGKFYVEPKYDGMRGQIHKGVDYEGQYFEDRIWSQWVGRLKSNRDGGVLHDSLFGGGLFQGVSDSSVAKERTEKGIEIFSRNLEDLTEMFPEIIEAVEKLECKSCILDCEIVGVVDESLSDYESKIAKGVKLFLPFQDTMTRRRKYDVGSQRESVPVRGFAFDLLELDGQDISRLDFGRRYEILKDLVARSSAQKILMIAGNHEVNNLEKLNELFDAYVEQGLEGVVLKKIEGRYLPGVRNLDWIKLKKTMKEGNVDSVDLVVLGWYAGSGKQVRFGMGALLAGVYNDETGVYEPVTKIGTGITEDQWDVIASRLGELRVNERPVDVADGDYEKPDGWVVPEVVVTVDADEISRSTVYSVGTDRLGYGLALRFPRLMVFDRDKLPEDATSVTELVEMHGIRGSGKKSRLAGSR